MKTKEIQRVVETRDEDLTRKMNQFSSLPTFRWLDMSSFWYTKWLHSSPVMRQKQIDFCSSTSARTAKIRMAQEYPVRKPPIPKH
jgi:hypothetical protein